MVKVANNESFNFASIGHYLNRVVNNEIIPTAKWLQIDSPPFLLSPIRTFHFQIDTHTDQTNHYMDNPRLTATLFFD